MHMTSVFFAIHGLALRYGFVNCKVECLISWCSKSCPLMAWICEHVRFDDGVANSFFGQRMGGSIGNQRVSSSWHLRHFRGGEHDCMTEGTGCGADSSGDIFLCQLLSLSGTASKSCCRPHHHATPDKQTLSLAWVPEIAGGRILYFLSYSWWLICNAPLDQLFCDLWLHQKYDLKLGCWQPMTSNDYIWKVRLSIIYTVLMVDGDKWGYSRVSCLFTINGDKLRNQMVTNGDDVFKDACCTRFGVHGWGQRGASKLRGRRHTSNGAMRMSRGCLWKWAMYIDR